MAGSPAQDPAVRPYQLGVAIAGGVALAASLVVLVGTADAAWLAPEPLLLLAILAVGSWLVLQNLVLFQWRGQQVALAPDEALVVLGLAFLPPAWVVLFAVPAMTIHQVRTRRGWTRGAFNVSVVLLATLVGVAAHQGLVDMGAPRFLAIIPAVALYTTATHLVVAGVLARLEGGATTLRVFRDRFGLPTLLHVGIGLSLGFALLGLWVLHPLALVAIGPLAYFAREHTTLVARADREILVHRRLAEVGRDLVGEPDPQRAGEAVLAVCGDLFRAGRARLRLADGTTLERDFEGGPHAVKPFLAQPVVARDGGLLGHLEIHPNARTNEDLGPEDRELLRAVAAHTAAALEAARALSAFGEIERLKEIDRFKTDFLGMAAHDLGTPLVPIRIQVHLLKEGLKNGGTDAQRRAVDILDRNLDRLQALVQDLLEASRLQAARAGLATEVLDLGIAIADAAEAWRGPAVVGEVRLAATFGNGLLVEADPRRLRQVLDNLLSNAVKFTPRGGCIDVSAAREGSRLVVRVRDTGPGIPPEARPALFQAFSQAPDGRRKGGTGLGLYISKGIVELHGGEMGCERGEGSGATFWFALPEAIPKPVARAASK